MTLPGFVALLLLPCLLVLLGRSLSWATIGADDSLPFRTAFHGLVGMVLFHHIAQVLSVAKVSWGPSTLAFAAGLLGAGLWWLGRRVPATPTRATRVKPDWGDGLAAYAVLSFTALSGTLWITTPDYVYHWGIKARRYFLIERIDFEYLSLPWNWVTHPDYPNLLAELFAFIAIAAGRFEDASAVLFTGVFLAAMAIAARETMARTVASPFLRRAGLAIVALSFAMFGIGQQMAGAADWMIALALLAALPALLRTPDSSGDLQIAFAAAFAAASKVEGVPLAGFVVVAHLTRRLMHRSFSLRAVLLIAAIVSSVVVPWLALVRHYGLLQKFNVGAFEVARLSVVASATLEALRLACWRWHGFYWFLLLAPLMLLERRLRLIAGVVLLQLAFYFYVYLTAQVDTRFLILSSLPRLFLHLIPTVLVCAVIGLDRLIGPRPTSPEPS